VLTFTPHVMKIGACIFFVLSLALGGNAYSLGRWFHGKSKRNSDRNSLATVDVECERAGCKVDIDGEGVGVTGGAGNLSVEGVDPGAHYLHVQCPGKQETSYFISSVAGKTLQVIAHTVATPPDAATSSSIATAEARSRLRRMVSQAVQLRASGQSKEAIELLRKAAQLDPRNGDLHRELGITFLMLHDWESARVEMLEAVRREPDNIDAHGGLAYALEKLGDLDEALKQYRICTRLDPHDTSYRDHYIEVLDEQYAQKAEKKR
jgi:tetratricopeptide (TPR) repeat protein